MNLYLDSSRIISSTFSFANLSQDEFMPLTALVRKHADSFRSDPKRIFALLRSTARYKELLDIILSQSGLLKAEKIKYPVALLLVHDLLISKTGITAGKGPLKDAVLRHKTRLQGEFTKLLIKRGISDISTFNGSSTDRTIRWIRVNTIIANSLPDLSFAKTDALPPSVRTVYADPYIPNLYAVANTHTKLLLSTNAYKTGEIILQDRASCFPAQILAPEPGEIVIDACAAPGNKTSHIAALMENQGRVVAYELNSDRAKVLTRMVRRAHASIVETVNCDFTISCPEDLRSSVSKILCDPSCSGSGIFRRQQFSFDGEEESESELAASHELASRLRNLSTFQKKIVRHALIDFPFATRVVYSTCSIHGEENEAVVRELLIDPDVIERGWHILPRAKAIPNWQRRGVVDWFRGINNQGYEANSPEELADACVRAEPIVDGGIGFFVAGFEREVGEYRSEPVEHENLIRQGKHTEQIQDNEEESEWAGFSDLPEANQIANFKNGHNTVQGGNKKLSIPKKRRKRNNRS
ncbi:S-adenosyl-L-methionine-dependent methyltransferase [Lipomyces oligophaga]|uniref:S-adenosyl-L-methionine-dependent methyltransferase n=1 Tax=Lipomyces oligophaga TaxID=45792 RepID=UPI0034CF9058